MASGSQYKNTTSSSRIHRPLGPEEQQPNLVSVHDLADLFEDVDSADIQDKGKSVLKRTNWKTQKLLPGLLSLIAVVRLPGAEEAILVSRVRGRLNIQVPNIIDRCSVALSIEVTQLNIDQKLARLYSPQDFNDATSMDQLVQLVEIYLSTTGLEKQDDYKANVSGIIYMRPDLDRSQGPEEERMLTKVFLGPPHPSIIEMHTSILKTWDELFYWGYLGSPDEPLAVDSENIICRGRFDIVARKAKKIYEKNRIQMSGLKWVLMDIRERHQTLIEEVQSIGRHLVECEKFLAANQNEEKRRK